MLDISKYKKGDIVKGHCCDDCAIRAGIKPKMPADSGVSSWPCEVCGHLGIGSEMKMKVGDWLTIRPISYSD